MLVELSGVKKVFTERNNSSRVIFDRMDFCIAESGRTVAIMGRSGSGKTTLLRILAGLDVAWEGDYSFCGSALPRSRSSMAKFRLAHIGYITQAYDLLADRTVLKNVMMGCEGVPDARSRAAEALRAVGLAGFEKQSPARLSGGEAQRVAIARALVKRPRLLLADEPTGALDVDTERMVLNLLISACREKTHLVLSTHSDQVAASCDVVYRIEDKRLVRQ